MIGDFIVSLASYSKRIDTLHICLESIFSQTLMPKKIILYFDNTVSPSDVPEKVLSYVKKGLEIKFVSNDIASHNKYFYTFQEYPNDIVITVDDDIIYDENTFLNLMQTHMKYPKCVCSSRVTYIKFDESNNVTSYNDWISKYDKIIYPSKQLIAIGVGGILYPPHIFTKEVFNKEAIVKLALTADDIWLKIMQLINDIYVVWTGQSPYPHQIPNTMENSLWRNINKYKNDDYIKKLINYYNLDLYKLIEKTEENI